MKRKFRQGAWVLFLFLLGGAGVAFADKIYLKDGKMYEGKLIGRSDRRYLFAIDVDGTPIQMSFFPEDVEKIDMGKNTREEQVPYLNEVESLKVNVKEDDPKVYELSLFNEASQEGAAAEGGFSFSEKDLIGALTEEEAEYYFKFNQVLARYTDKLAAVQVIYLNIAQASRDDLATAQKCYDDMYFDLNHFPVPDSFKRPHQAYLDSVKAAFLAYGALGERQLDEALQQFKVSEDAKAASLAFFRSVITAKAEQVLRVRNEPPTSDETDCPQ